MSLVAGLRENVKWIGRVPSEGSLIPRRVLEEYGDESVKTALLARSDVPGYWRDYLLRSRKGHFNWKQYPGRYCDDRMRPVLDQTDSPPCPSHANHEQLITAFLRARFVYHKSKI